MEQRQDGDRAGELAALANDEASADRREHTPLDGRLQRHLRSKTTLDFFSNRCCQTRALNRLLKNFRFRTLRFDEPPDPPLDAFVSMSPNSIL